MADSIYGFIKEQETAYGQEVEVLQNWTWNMKEHIRASMLFKHGKFLEATNDLKHKQPFKNVIYPLLNLRYRAEDIDLKDVVIYVDEPDNDHLSFLVKKYHDEVYAPKHDLETLFDTAKEEKIDFGGTLVRKTTDGWVVEGLETIAFADQTDLLSGPIGFKSFYSPDELLGMADAGWGDPSNGATISLDELITMAEAAKIPDAQTASKVQTPGKYVEVYRVHGAFEKTWLTGEDNETDESKDRYVRQMHIVAFYKNREGKDEGVTLYRKKEFDNPFKVHLSGKKIRNRALSYGGIEELLDPQIWTNYSEIRKRGLLDAISKIIPWTDDEGLTDRNTIKDMDNMEFLNVQQGRTIGVMNVQAPNIQFFTQWLGEWETTAQNTSGSTPALMGQSAAGTAYRLQALVTQQGQQLHEYRKGRFASFIHELYTDGIIPDIIKELGTGARFFATLTPDELEFVANCLVRSLIAKEDLNRLLDGQLPMLPDEKAAFEQKIRSDFAAKGNKHFFEILQSELEGKVLKVKIDVAGKQADLGAISDKMTQIFAGVLAPGSPPLNPQQIKLINQLLEYKGLDPINFGYTDYNKAAAPAPQQPSQGQNTAQPSPIMPMQQPNPQMQ